MRTNDFYTQLHNVGRIRQGLLQRGFVWGCVTATAVYLLVALWVRAGAM